MLNDKHEKALYLVCAHINTISIYCPLIFVAQVILENVLFIRHVVDKYKYKETAPCCSKYLIISSAIDNDESDTSE